MTQYNILLLSAGRRVELVQCFKRAANKLKIDSKIVTGDASEVAPALYFSDDFYILPKVKEDNYIKKIIEICNSENISLIVPTIDTELLILAENKQQIEDSTDAKVLISNSEVVKVCRDKYKTNDFLEKYGFGKPKLILKKDLDAYDIEFPLFIKPKSGSSSINTFRVNNKKELETYLNIVEEPIIQEFIEGDEFTVDVFLDFKSQVISVVPRLRIATRSGEISKGKIVKDREIIDDVIRLMEILKPIGHITVQLMKTDSGIKYIEVNPRFGGGAPMSIMSGADSCRYLYSLLMNKSLTYNESYSENDIYLRFDQSIKLSENLEVNFDG